MATRSKASWLLQPASAVAAAFALASHAFALSPDLHVTQLHHTAFTAKDGAPSGIESLAQTSDGYLWIAGAAGLFRFDGVRFEHIDGIRGQRLPSTNVLSLFAPRNGGLWIGYRFGGTSFLHDGNVTNYAESEDLLSGSVTRFAQDDAGAIWAITSRGLRRFDGSRWQDIRETFKLSSEYAKALGAARDGTLWIVIGRTVMRLPPGQTAFVPTPIETSDELASFVEAPDGTLWLTDQELGARLVYAPAETASTAESRGWIALRSTTGEPLWGRLIDRDGTLWAAASSGIHRIKQVAHLADRASTREPYEVFSNGDGLSASYANALLEDREGNVWIGTAGGVDRFREARLTRVPVPQGSNGFAVAAGDDGALLVGVDLDDGALSVTGSSTVNVIPGPRFITCAHRDNDGDLWLGGRGELWHSTASAEGAKWTAIALPIDRENANYYPVQAIAKDGSGGLWVSVVRGGVLRRTGGQWTRIGDPALTLATGADGRVWLGYPRSRIQIVDTQSNATRDYSVADGLDLGNVMSILPGTRDAWVGGELGLARFDGSAFHPVIQQDGTQLPSVSGIASTPQGELWLSTSVGAIRLSAEEVRRLSENPRHRVRGELFNHLDGLPGTPNAIRPLPSIAAGTDGRLWFATTNGVAWVDPGHIRANMLAPHVEVQSVVADDQLYEARPDLHLPVNPRNVQIAYTALSLSVPERVRFRYQLNEDEPWQDAGTRRAAYFTDLSPGDYRFRVMASNDDGVWNETGASVAFTIPPTFYQTRWFHGLCALAGIALLAIFYHVRVRQLAAQVRGRLEARLAERERIARELHDTLLQGMQGLIWRFQAATDRIPADEPARDLMEQSLDRADRLLEESRDKVKDLRPAANTVAELAQALATEGEQFAKLHSATFRVSVEGAPRDLHPIVREEGFMIGREAMANAFRHSGATDIEVEVSYGDGTLHVRIRDDGRGIGGDVLDAGGKPGHFGLLGMRERAKKLGAHLEIWSKHGAGTEIDLRVPANVAYRRSPLPARDARFWLGATS